MQFPPGSTLVAGVGSDRSARAQVVNLLKQETGRFHSPRTLYSQQRRKVIVSDTRNIS